MDGHGTTTIAWVGKVYTTVFAKRWRADGLLGKRRVVAATTAYRSSPSTLTVEANRTGDTAVAFYRRLRPGVGERYGYFVAQRSAGSWAAPRRVATSRYLKASAALAQSGNVEVVWQQGNAWEEPEPIKYRRFTTPKP
jgi:hypothetical protein